MLKSLLEMLPDVRIW